MGLETPRVALVAGASGMVGVALVRALIAGGEYARVIALTRRPLPFEAPRLANRIIRFDAMEEQLRAVACEDAFCCLGTTRREAGSAQAFRAVDHDLVLRFARCAQNSGAKTLVAVSSVRSSRFFRSSPAISPEKIPATPVTRWPRRAAARANADPTKPEAPVRKIIMAQNSEAKKPRRISPGFLASEFISRVRVRSANGRPSEGRRRPARAPCFF